MSKSRAQQSARSGKAAKRVARNRTSLSKRSFHRLRLEALEARELLAVVYRVNAGGPSVAGTPAWTADTNASPSPFRNSAAAPGGAFITTSAINVGNASIPAGTPASLFQSERWEPAGGSEMNWAFPVTPGQYEVRLYFSEIYSGAYFAGGRTFSVQIEGATLLQNYDAFAEVGSNAGVVKKFTVTSDATLNINFVHGIEDPAVKAIEILTAGTTTPGALSTSSSNLSFGNVTVGAGGQQSITLSNTGASGAPSITITGTTISGTNASQFTDSFNDGAPVVLAPGQSTTVNVTFNPSSAGAKTASLQIAHNGSNNPLTISLTGAGETAPPPTGNVVYRVNAGGPAISGIPSWSADTDASPSPYRNSAASPAGAATTATAINVSNASIPAGTPAALFQSERWDNNDATEMSWAFPVTAGLYDVRLYFSEFYDGVFSVGLRTFDVQIEGVTVLDNYDVFAEVGSYAGVMKNFTVLSDPTLNILFQHGVEDPAIKAIEIVSAGAVANQLETSSNDVDFGQVVVGQTSTKTFSLLNAGSSGDPSIVIDPASATLAPANTALTFQFSQAQPITLAPGQSTTVSVTYSPASVGNNAATLGIPHSGTNSPLSVTLQGQGVSSIPIGFGKSALAGTSSTLPTSLQFGPDGRLYVAQQYGLIKVYTVTRNAANDYSVTATETIDLIQQIPNHDDDGTPNPSITERLVTGILVTGTAANPVIYASSSDPRIYDGSTGSNDTDLDTNSGVISKLTKNGNTWSRLDLVRGLPRSEEDHAANGLQIDPATNTLYLAIGGNTNMGAPSNLFALLPEYALSAAILSIDLDAIGQTTYDLPTLDDETRVGLNDANDPFGGNDGLNQAKLVPGGPVQVYSPGYRNPYDVLITSSGRMYTISNGPNADWGDVPIGEGPGGNATNQQNEPGTTYGDALHYITGQGYYGGHPNPTRSNPNNTFNASNPQSPVTVGNPIESDFLAPGPENHALVVYPNSTNGLTEYTASNFGGAMQGDLLTASFDNSIKRIVLNGAGDALISSNNLFSNVGATPLDVTVQDDVGALPGTIWVADIVASEIYVFEPSDFDDSGGPVDPNDTDGDHYTNDDEIANGTDPNNAGDVPEDFDGDFTSNLLDLDDDNDTLPDTSDLFAVDAQNGNFTPIGTLYTWENNAPRPGGLLDLGFTGLMTNGTSDYQSLYDPTKLTPGGAAGVLTIDFASTGTALGSTNTQDQAFQFGVNVAGVAQNFAGTTRVLSPWSGQTPQAGQQIGLFVGVGDQDNYVQVVVDGGGAVTVISEINGAATTVAASPITLAGLAYVDLFVSVDPVNETVQTSYVLPGGTRTLLGSPIAVPSGWLSTVMAVGLISTTPTSVAPMSVTWDYLGMIYDAAGQLGASLSSISFGSTEVGTAVQKQLTLTNLGSANDPSITITGTTIGGANVNQFSDSFNDATPLVLAPGQSTTFNVTFLPTSAGAKSASLQIAHDGANNPLNISLSGTGEVTPASTVVYRVNAGGPAVAGTPNWTADTSASPSPYRNSAAAPGNAFVTTSIIDVSNASIPAGTPASLFQSERWEPAGGSEMNWTFPVTPGQYEVRLYFSEIYTGAYFVGGRTFSVQIEGVTVLQSYDTYAEVGANAGVVKTFTITSDANLNINFVHGFEDPAVKAIEILTTGAAVPTSTELVAAPIAVAVSPTTPDLAFAVTVSTSDATPTAGSKPDSPSTISGSTATRRSVSTPKSRPIAQHIAHSHKAKHAHTASDAVMGNQQALDQVLRDVDLLRPLSRARKRR